MDFRSLAEIAGHCESSGYKIGFSGDMGQYGKSRNVNGFTFPNSIAILPMEGCDSDEGGGPSQLTLRRYARFAQSGASLIWVEATAVVEEGRNSRHQLFLHEGTAPAFAQMVEEIRRVGLRSNGFAPIVILQLTHSGRYSKPYGLPEPILAAHNPYLDERFSIPADKALLSDEALDALQERYVKAAMLAKRAGFDGVDVKSCHGYLVSELLSAHTREGRYGGGYEGRTRFISDAVGNIRAAAGADFLIAARMNVYDAMPYPYGWGVHQDDPKLCDLWEPVRLLSELMERGLGIAGLTIGNPYYNPHYNRPFDKGPYSPPEPPLKGVERILELTAHVKKSLPKLAVVGAGYTYLREYAAQAGAYALKEKNSDFIGFGRQAFAYPQFAKDLLTCGKMDGKKVCITCSKCSELMRSGLPAGCVIRDGEIYAGIYGNRRK